MSLRNHKTQLKFYTKTNRMKNIVQNLMLIVLVAVTLNACTDNELVFVATPPADGQLLINPNVTSIVLLKVDKAETAISFSWDKSNYGVETPLSYTLEIDEIAGDFSNPETEITESTELALTHGKLNAIALGKNLATDVEGQIKVRLKSSLNYGNLPSYSKVETISVTPYLDLFYDLPVSNELYIQGDAVASNWGTPPDAQKMTKINNSTFAITIELIGGRNFALISTQTAWSDPAYVAPDANQSLTGGSFRPAGSNTVPAWGGSPMSSPSVTGIYEIIVNFTTGKYTVTLQ